MGYVSAEATLIAWAKATTTINNLVGGRISKQLPEDPTFPYLTVRRVSGAPDSSEAPIDLPLIQFSCYAARYKSGDKAKPDWAAAEAIALEIMHQADVLDMAPVTLSAANAILHGLAILSMGEVPEPDSNWAHYQLTVLATIKEA